MLKPFLTVFTLLAGVALIGAAALPQQSPPPASPVPAPANLSNQVNPVKPAPESLARGKKIYGYECALCHGDDGSGNGDLASKMKTKMADLRDPTALKSYTDGQIYAIINQGKGEMEGEGARVKPEDTWSLVNYVRSMSHGGQPTAAATPAPGPS
ncbi:MAG: cytochrome c [Acidobacteriaceae bacterium]